MFIYDDIKVNGWVTIGDAQVSVEFLSQCDAAKLSELGVLSVPDPVIPDTQFFDYTENADGTIKPVDKPLEEVISAMIKRIDSDIDDIYGDVVGNRIHEYEQSEIEAKAYKDAGYIGIVPPKVLAWSDAKVVSAPWIAAGKNPSQWAADDIIATAGDWETAENTLRAMRLKTKEAVRLSVSVTDISGIQSQWKTFVSNARLQLGI